MNVMRLFANTVRRQTGIFRSGSGPPQPLIVDPDKEPYKYEIQRLAIYHLAPSSTSTTDEKMHAISKMGHFCWTGGPDTAEFACKNYLQQLCCILQSDSEPYALKMVVVKSLAAMCCGSQRNQDLARLNGLIGLLVDFMVGDGGAETRKWCLHTLFHLLVSNQEAQMEAIRTTGFKRCVQRGLHDDWGSWHYNEAREIQSMLNIA